jgi:hypothetical protein
VIHIITDCSALEPSVNVISNLYNITPCLIATEYIQVLPDHG